MASSSSNEIAFVWAQPLTTPMPRIKIFEIMARKGSRIAKKRDLRKKRERGAGEVRQRRGTKKRPKATKRKKEKIKRPKRVAPVVRRGIREKQDCPKNALGAKSASAARAKCANGAAQKATKRQKKKKSDKQKKRDTKKRDTRQAKNARQHGSPATMEKFSKKLAGDALKIHQSRREALKLFYKKSLTL
jgi:hypothetical protein